MKKSTIQKQLEVTLADLETLTDEIRVQLDLAGKEANDTWNEKYEPLLFRAREHAKAAKAASKTALEETIQAFESFRQSL